MFQGILTEGLGRAAKSPTNLQIPFLRPPHKGPTFVVGIAGWGAIRRVRTFFPDNSRFGRFNSRLGGANSRLDLLREFFPKGLISPGFFVNKLCLSGKIDEIPVSTGKAGNVVRTRDGVPKGGSVFSA
jgi:hypothetical protein